MLNSLILLKMQQGKVSQNLLMVIAVLITTNIAVVIYFTGKDNVDMTAKHGDAHAEGKEHAENEEKHSEVVTLTTQQMTEHGIQLAKVDTGAVINAASYPAKLIVNTDRQAHISPSFSGHVESVNVNLGQQVKKGQVLATLFVPDLVDQQANLKLEQANLELALQDYERERQLWSQGISAQQDYQQAHNIYKRAQIQVQAAKNRLSAFGAGTATNGRYALTAPISGVVSKKDLVVGENVQLANQLFTIDQFDQLWLEFVVLGTGLAAIAPNQEIEFKSLQTGNTFKAQVKSLNSEADAQTGRLQVRAKVLSSATELRPNLMVNVQLQDNTSKQVLRVKKTAIQDIEGQTSVFLIAEHNKKIKFKAQPIVVGQASADGEWIEIHSGLTQHQQYVAQGSFLLKSELEKGEASHEH